MSIFVYTGLPGSGKTTKLAQIAYTKLNGFQNQKEKGKKKPRLFSNIKFSEEVETEHKDYIHYFNDIYDLPNWDNSEIFIDEASVYFDSRLWEKLPLEIRRFLFTHRHLNTNLYLIAQDFPTIDNSFRRLTEKMYHVRKLLSSREPSDTRPDSKHPFNLCTIGEVKKELWGVEKEHYEFENSHLELFRKKHFSIFDTKQSLPTQPLPPLRKEVRICPDDNYQRVRYI